MVRLSSQWVRATICACCRFLLARNDRAATCSKSARFFPYTTLEGLRAVIGRMSGAGRMNALAAVVTIHDARSSNSRRRLIVGGKVCRETLSGRPKFDREAGRANARPRSLGSNCGFPDSLSRLPHPESDIFSAPQALTTWRPRPLPRYRSVSVPHRVRRNSQAAEWYGTTVDDEHCSEN